MIYPLSKPPATEPDISNMFRRKYRWLATGIVVFLLSMRTPAVFAADPQTQAGENSDPEATYLRQAVPFIKKYCLECHGPAKAEAELGFHKFKSAAMVAADQKTWQGVLQMLRTGAMPPAD